MIQINNLQISGGEHSVPINYYLDRRRRGNAAIEP